jgi:hypothetical protein
VVAVGEHELLLAAFGFVAFCVRVHPGLLGQLLLYRNGLDLLLEQRVDRRARGRGDGERAQSEDDDLAE